MLCQRCKKRQATVNHVEIINGDTCAVHLCPQCAYEAYGEFEHNVADAIISGLFGEPLREEKVCPGCGLRFTDYERSGLLGCPSCYDVFKEEIMPYVARIQGKTTHVGKGGGIYTSEHDLRIRLAALQDKMEEALSSGNYAEAGRINAQMNALKKKIAGGGV